MQILESSVLGLRAARHRFASPSSSVSVTLFPMVHVGEAAFFTNVHDEALSHDVVLVEGVRSPVVRRLTRSYRWIDFDRLGLVLQPRIASRGSGARIVHADLSPDEFHAEWSKVPFRYRAAGTLLTPLIGLKLRWFGSRESIAARLGMEDSLSSEEILSWDPDWANLMHSLVGARDQRLVECLRREIDRLEKGSIAIVYGAGHMRGVLTELKRLGFRSTGSSWQTIFSC